MKGRMARHGSQPDWRRRRVILASGVTSLAAVNLTLLMPAAHSAHAGAFTQALPWVALAATLVMLVFAALMGRR